MAGTAQIGSFSFSFNTFEDLNEFSLKLSLIDANENFNPWLSFDFHKNMLTALPEIL